MRELNVNEIDAVGGALEQGDVVMTNVAIIGIGVGVIAGGLTAPVWFPVLMIGVSVASVWSMYKNSR